MIPNFASPYQWANHVFGQAQLGDLRRTKRLVNVAATLAAHPTASFCQAFQQWPTIKAAYRFIQNQSFDHSDIQSPIQKTTVDACKSQSVILAIADTTSFNFTSHRATQGLGTISQKESQGLWFHSSLALTTDGLPLGVLHQKAWVRNIDDHGKKHLRKQNPIQQKESYRWVESVIQGSKAFDTLNPNQRPFVIHIFDREGDIYDVFQAALQMKAGAIIRSRANRKTTHHQQKIHDLVLNSKTRGQQTLQIKTIHNNKPSNRKANVTYQACPVQLKPIHDSHIPLNLNVVAVTEQNPPPDTQPIQWILITTQPINSLQDIQSVVDHYKLRWHIEQYHLILKSGCRIEKVQFETAQRIIKILAVFAPIACRILTLTYLARINPQEPCTNALTQQEWKALYTHINKKLPDSKTKPPSIQQAILWIGRLGGHLGRKSDKMPGVRTLWKGLRDLELLTSMFLNFQPQSQSSH